MNKKTIRLDGLWQMAWCDIGAGRPELFARMDKLSDQALGDAQRQTASCGCSILTSRTAPPILTTILTCGPMKSKQ